MSVIGTENRLASAKREKNGREYADVMDFDTVYDANVYMRVQNYRENVAMLVKRKKRKKGKSH